MEKETKTEVRCPHCKSLLLKLLNCLSGVKFIEIKCKRCKKLVLVP